MEELTSNRPTFTLCYTTIRPEYVTKTINAWISRALRPHMVRFVVTTDADRADVIAHFRHLEVGVVAIQPDLPGDCVKGWNLAAETAKLGGVMGDVMIAVADDFDPPEHWDEQLSTVAPAGWWLKDHVVHVWDGYNTDIFTLAIITATRYLRFGYLFYPAYQSMFCDTELTYVAKADGVVIEAMHLLFEHLHPDTGKRARDQHDLVHASASRWATGQRLFEYRQAVGFPLDMGPMADDREVTARDCAVCIQAIKDDFCLEEVCNRLVEVGLTTFFFCIPDEYWSGKVTSPAEAKEVTDIAARLKENPRLAIHVRSFDVARYRTPGKSRIMIETDVRNEALGWVRSFGFEHIIIADGDELWRLGLMGALLDVVNSLRPQCVYTGMVPTVGLPGYPIEGALDYATIYVGRGTLFSECRGTFGTKYELPGYRIIHFTATRRTMNEIIQKSRDSGHYDDPNYDFEGWIKNTLPYIREGMTNVHMYKPHNPWKRVRAWTLKELEEIPPSLHRFLAVPASAPSPHVSGRFTVDGVRKAN